MEKSCSSLKKAAYRAREHDPTGSGRIMFGWSCGTKLPGKGWKQSRHQGPVGCLSMRSTVFRRGNHMNWFYWNTAWSLFFSLVWFMTITHNPDAQIADAHLRDEAFGG